MRFNILTNIQTYFLPLHPKYPILPSTVSQNTDNIFLVGNVALMISNN